LKLKVINELFKPLQSMGLFGPRDIHKKLVELGKECQRKMDEFMTDIDIKPTPHAIGRLRGEVRRLLAKELGEIDEIVERELAK
jgi:hypothetical protein